MSLSSLTQRSSVSRPVTASRRSAVVVKASADSRRAILGGFLAGVSLSVSGAAFAAATPVDIIDDRKAVKAGFDIIYEARDSDLSENVRQGRTQARSNIDIVISRVRESESRLDNDLEPSIKKNYWLEARQELRRQTGTLRFDLNTLAQTKAKDEKKKALELRKDFIAKVEALDFALRKKDEAASAVALESAKTALDTVLAFVL
ncbi:hypothetical protein CEUSTIGMA_g2143.t1 [Chlamydomonas eustigma]|uniref:Oxygen-evolving enhancer protein 3, chloroplastic n=1 Tax=Chlamydomonas eustigma TaxID=1157962 RepID=A0A250WV64_9CHLO|nr:hypothetical protein CEUSTIGMA_g2143.t1 [Chlamydomonas eustigma]|eukprot:GAX74695.1 hypothetical protein CEUSTIGMA_g2143.t1 [Chlamydomonas eustigma]